MKNVVLFFALFMISTTAKAQLPSSWSGKWEGELVVFSGTREVNRVPVNLTISELQKDSVYQWTTVYDGEPKVTKEYLLKAVNTKTGYYLIDEQNSILLDSYFIGGKLYSRFEVMDNLLTSTYWMEGEELHYEFTSSSFSSTVTTGGGIIEGDTIPEVIVFPVRNVQRGILVKSDN